MRWRHVLGRVLVGWAGNLRIDNSRQSVFCGIRLCSVVIDCYNIT